MTVSDPAIDLREALADASALLTLGDAFEAQSNWTAAFLCLLRAMQLGAAGLSGRLVDLHCRAAKARHIPLAQAVSSADSQVTVTVVMPTRGDSARIERSIESVLAQTFPHWELLIVNDGGDAERLQGLLQQVGSARVQCLHRSERGGPSAARNLGISRARGQFIAYLDDDDLYHPHHLSILLEGLRRSSGEFAFARCHRVYGQWVDGEFRESCRQLQPWPSTRPTIEQLRTDNFICTLNVVHSRAALGQCGGWDPGLRHLEDWEFWTRLATQVGMVPVDNFTGEYRLVEDRAASTNASVLQKRQMDFFEALLLAMFDDGNGWHRIVNEALAEGQGAAAQSALDELCRQRGAQLAVPGRRSADELSALLLAKRSGLRSPLMGRAIGRLMRAAAKDRVAGVRAGAQRMLDRHVSWRLRAGR